MLSLILFLIGIVEFIAAQAPYSMKGLVLGAQYTLTLFFAAIESILYYTLFNRKLSIWGTGTVSCGFWYALLALFVELSFYVLLLLLMKRYKMRKREDLLPNEYFFAERYYLQDTVH